MMKNQELDMMKLLKDAMKNLKTNEWMLGDMPRNPVNLTEIIKKAQSKGRFKLEDRVSGKDYTIKTFKWGKRDYITIISESFAGKYCMRPVEKAMFGHKHTKSMKSAAQLHYDTLNYLHDHDYL